MKFVNSIITTSLSLTLLLAANVTLAQSQNENGQCAYISTKDVPMSNKTRALTIIKHNGIKIEHVNYHFNNIDTNTGTRVNDLYRGIGSIDSYHHMYKNPKYNKLKLQPGTHTLTGFAAFRSDAARFAKQKPTKPFTFTINVEAGKQYYLIAQKNENQDERSALPYVTKLLKVVDVNCLSSDGDNTLNALTNAQQIINYTSLPQDLQSEYSQLVMEIGDYYRQQGADKDTLTIARASSKDYVFGLRGAPIKWNNQFALRVNHVNQASTAQSLGLQKEDLIIAVRDQPIPHNGLAFLSGEIAKTNIGEPLPFTVIRNGKNIALNNHYQPSNLAAFELNISLNHY